MAGTWKLLCGWPGLTSGLFRGLVTGYTFMLSTGLPGLPSGHVSDSPESLRTPTVPLAAPAWAASTASSNPA
jgi:hypothetical protein